MAPGGTAAKVPGKDVAGVRIYGKTGTAQAPGNLDEAPWGIVKELGRRKKDRIDYDPRDGVQHHSWFVAIVEPDGASEPCQTATTGSGRYVVAAAVPHGGLGSRAAAPLALEVIRSLRAHGYLGEAAQVAGATETRATTRAAGR
jgi:cell division protein FtsI/penicillin-binding protein 2